jgi:hypothetical protein
MTYREKVEYWKTAAGNANREAHDYRKAYEESFALNKILTATKVGLNSRIEALSAALPATHERSDFTDRLTDSHF